jgi:hypothetical protein
MQEELLKFENKIIKGSLLKEIVARHPPEIRFPPDTPSPPNPPPSPDISSSPGAPLGGYGGGHRPHFVKVTKGANTKGVLDNENWIHFTTISQLGACMEEGNGYYEVSFSDDEDIFIKPYGLTFKAKNLTLGEKVLFKDITDIEILAHMIKWNSNYILYFQDKVFDNEKFAEHAISCDGSAIKYFSEKIRDNKRLTLAVVTQNGFSIDYCSAKMRDDEEVAIAAIMNRPHTIMCCSDAIKNNKKIAIIVVSLSGQDLFHLSDELKDDEDIVKIAMKNDIRALKYCSERLKWDLRSHTLGRGQAPCTPDV